jgi:hypothetical protein
MSDSKGDRKIVALRLVVSNLAASVEEYARIYEEVKALPYGGSDDKRRELDARLIKTMLHMVGQAHLIGCRFFLTMCMRFSTGEALAMFDKAMDEAHKDTNDIHNLMKGHVPWRT